MLRLRLLLPLVCAAALAAPGAAEASGACDVVASLHGSDADPGTPDAPVRTVRRAFALLAPGETGCLTAGQTFHELVNVNPSGAPGAPLTLRSTDGGRASFTGQIRVNGSHIRISGIDFRGLGAVADFAPKTYHLGVDGDDVVLSDLAITSPRGICVDVGQIDAFGGVPGPRADGFVLERSRIHGCGLANDLGAGDSGVHGIYLKHTQGARLADLFVHDNVNRGIQLWPAAHGTLIERVVLDGNGSNLNIGSYAPQGFHSRDTLVRQSVIADARLRSCSGCDVPPGDTESVLGNFPPGAADYGNRVTDNCVFQSDPARLFGGYGYTQSGNRVARPAYVDRAAGDLRAVPGSACEGDGPAAPVPGPLASAPAPALEQDEEPAPGQQPAEPAPAPAPAPQDGGMASPGGAPAPIPTPPPAAVRRPLRPPVIAAVLRTRRGLTVRVRTPGAGRLRLAAVRRGRVVARRTVAVRGRRATVRLPVARRALRLDAVFRSPDGRVSRARLTLR